MPESTLVAARYPTQDDGPYGGEQIQAAVLDLEPYTVPRFPTIAARDAAYAKFVLAGGVIEAGMQCWVAAGTASGKPANFVRRADTWRALDTDWTLMTGFATGFGSLGSPGEECAYRVANGRVDVQFGLTRDSGTRSGVFFTLPAEVRPDRTRWVLLSSSGAAQGELKVLPSGAISFAGPGTATTVVGWDSWPLPA